MKKTITNLLMMGMFLLPTYLFSQAPSNDNCENAITLTVDAPCVSGTNFNATTQAGEVAAARCWFKTPNHTVWYKFTTSTAGSYTISTDNGTGTDTQMKLYSGACPGTNPNEVGCAEDNGTNFPLASIITANLLATTTYLVQVDIYDGPENAPIVYDSWCINVKKNVAAAGDQPIANDCFNNAIDLSTQLYNLTSTKTYACVSYDYKNATYAPNREIVNAGGKNDNLSCYTGATTKYYGVWYKFTVGTTAPKVWLDVISVNSVGRYVAALYEGTPSVTPTCAPNETINGLTYVDCSAGGLWISIPPTGLSDALGGPLDVTAESVTYPRINLSTLTPGKTYYLRVFQRANPANASGLANDKIKICVESSTPVGVGSDRCPTSPNIGEKCGTMKNLNMDVIYLNQGNAGTYGSSGNIPRADEPVSSVGAAGDIKKECLGPFQLNGQFNQNSINNSVVYQFEVDACSTCQANIEIDLENIKIEGSNIDLGNGVQAQLLNTNLCEGSSTSLVAQAYGGNCLAMRPTGDAQVPSGKYSLVIDGFNGCLLQYDVHLIVKYSGPNCQASKKPVSNFTASIGTDTLCVNTNTRLTFTGDVGGVQGAAPRQACPSTTTYLWNFDGGTGGNTTTVGPHDVQWSTGGVKTITCKVITDGCESIVTKTIVVSPQLVQTMTVPPTVCVDNPFDVSISGTGATAYTKYVWNFGGAIVNSGTGAGPYNVTFKTAGAKTISVTMTNKGCNPVIVSQNITVNPSPTADFSVDNLTTCQTDSVTITVLNPVAGNSYTWDFNGATTNPSVTNGPGPYKAIWNTSGSKTIGLTISNAGCVSPLVTKNVSVVDLPVLTLSKTDLSCFGTSDGSITASGSGGSGSYLYNINGGAYAAAATFNGKAKGTYTIGIKDATNLCIGLTKQVTIAEPAKIVLSSSNPTNSTCGNADGSIVINQSGGVGAIQYKIDGGTYQNPPIGNLFSGLAAGSHTAYAKDSKGCIGELNFIIVDAGAIPLEKESQTNVSCFDGNNGSLKVRPAVPGGTYTYTLSKPGVPTNTTGIFNNLEAGTYSVSAVSGGNCKSTIGNIVITQPDIISADISGNNPLCKNSSDGTATLTNVLGGTGTKTFSWNTSPVQTGATATGLAAGTYEVTITDGNSCFIKKSVTLVDPTNLVLDKTVNDAHCGKADGVVTISASAGNGSPFTFSKDDATYQTSGVFNNLTAGTYTFYAKDKNACKNSISVTVADLPGPKVTVGADKLEICVGSSSQLSSTTNGVEFIWSPVAGLDNPNSASPKASPTQTTTYVCTVKDAFGCENTASVTIKVNPKDKVTFAYPSNEVCSDVASTKPVLETGVEGTFFASPSTGLVFVDDKTGEIDVKNSTPGIYNITFSSSKVCPNDTTITFKIKSLPLAEAGVNKNLCFGSSEFLGSSAIPGASYTWSPVTDLDNPNIEQPKVTSSYNGTTVMSRMYYMTVVKEGCSSMDSVLVNFNPSPIAEAGENKLVKCNGKVNLLATATGGAAPYKYKWLNGPATANYNNVGVGKYFVTITDNVGCTSLDSVEIGSDPNTLRVALSLSNPTPCPGESFTLTATPTNQVGTVTYTWNDAGVPTGPGPHTLIATTAKKTYIVSAKDANGCTWIDSVKLTPQPLPVAAFTYDKNNQTINFSGSTLRNANKWEWDMGDRSPMLTGQSVSYTYLTKGAYDVILYLYNPCGKDSLTCTVDVNGGVSTGTSDTCGSFSTGFVSLKKSNELKLYPNPTEGNIVLEMNHPEIETVKVFDLMGKMVYSSNFNTAVNRLMLDLSNNARGIYTVQVIGKSFNISKKVELMSRY